MTVKKIKVRKIKDCFTVPLWLGGALVFVLGCCWVWVGLAKIGFIISALGFYLYLLRW